MLIHYFTIYIVKHYPEALEFIENMTFAYLVLVPLYTYALICVLVLAAD